ncbi:MAG: 30S ribosomal protein S6 [Candidatus Omnitrophota bacterium]
MDKYELVVVLDATLSQQEKSDITKNVAQEIENCGGRVINSQVWIEKHKMSFLMKRRPEGTYYLFNFEGGGPKLAELRRALKLNEQILRSLIVKVKK